MGTCHSVKSAQHVSKSSHGNPRPSELKVLEQSILAHVNELTGGHADYNERANFRIVLEGELAHMPVLSDADAMKMVRDENAPMQALHDLAAAIDAYLNAARGAGHPLSGQLEDCLGEYEKRASANLRSLSLANAIHISATLDRYAAIKVMRDLPAEIENGSISLSEAEQRVSSYDELHEARSDWHKKISQEQAQFIRNGLLAHVADNSISATIAARIWHDGLGPEHAGLALSKSLIDALRQCGPQESR